MTNRVATLHAEPGGSSLVSGGAQVCPSNAAPQRSLLVDADDPAVAGNISADDRGKMWLCFHSGIPAFRRPSISRA
jgi:hypothetical protein